MDKNEIIVSIVAAVISSGVINTVLANFLYKKRLNEENKKRVGEMFDGKILEALLQARELAQKIFTQEIYGIENRIPDMFETSPIYPAIMQSHDSLCEYITEVSEYRKKYDLYLNIELGLNIAYIDKYVHQLLIYADKNFDQKCYPTLGALFIFDLQKWASSFDVMVVREINKKSYFLESHSNPEWDKKRCEIIEGQWKKTLLYDIIKDECNDEINRETFERAKAILSSLKQ